MNVLGIHVKCTRERRIQLKLPAVDEIAHLVVTEENGEPLRYNHSLHNI